MDLKLRQTKTYPGVRGPEVMSTNLNSTRESGDELSLPRIISEYREARVHCQWTGADLEDRVGFEPTGGFRRHLVSTEAA